MVEFKAILPEPGKDYTQPMEMFLHHPQENDYVG